MYVQEVTTLNETQWLHEVPMLNACQGRIHRQSYLHDLFLSHNKKSLPTSYLPMDVEFNIRLTFLFLGMGSSKRRLLVSPSSIPSSVWEGVRKALKLSADRGGDGVDGLDWSLGAFQLQYPLLLVLEGTNPPSFQDPFRDSVKNNKSYYYNRIIVRGLRSSFF